jgi:ectoine hydroxylase-related dioxygenase (phytanoyl-CoA dioxygenase family)
MLDEVERFKREGWLRNVTTEGDGRTPAVLSKNLQVTRLSQKSALFRALPFQDQVMGAVRQLIGEPLVLYFDQIFLKPGRTGVGTKWHQDNAYFKVPDPSKGVGMWVALHDASVANGTLRVIPRSHTRAAVHQRDLESDHHIFCSVAEDEAVDIELEAGGVLFFNFMTAHATGPNQTDRERAGLALHFLRTEAVPKDDPHFAPHCIQLPASRDGAGLQ